eukprot:GHVU01077351.1.p1 GENE.GHVU01077351.1~~GHVU01077351.1.p1  ORF type:complete len:1037 (+),score=260.62 GHVU01077351.1:329-3112(+)
MTKIDVRIDPESNLISVLNDGDGVPVEKHKEHKIYVPELIFGHLLTSDNYDDTEARVTGGRNGYGAKLANVFSNEFTAECADGTRNRKLTVKWQKNMSTQTPSEPKPEKYDGKDYVKISFKPDLARFKLQSLRDGDNLALMTKRVYDIAGTCGVKVTLNGQKLPVKNFDTYVDMYECQALKEVKIHDKSGDRWEVVVTMSDGQFQQCSFVNHIHTQRGGTHVNHVVEPIVKEIAEKWAAKNKKGMVLKPAQIKQHLWVFVKCLIVNPNFDSQTKETLTTLTSKFGSKMKMSKGSMDKILKGPIMDNVLSWASAKQHVDLSRKLKGGSKQGRDRIVGLPKLDDAVDAGGAHSADCSLILTEGDSAKASCLAGLSVVGRSRYGVFPLKGKLLNVREARHEQLASNEEIKNILKILGISYGQKDLASVKTLRYGSIIIMTDQDLDGSHIKGLLINMIERFWPNLLKLEGFLKEFVTPIVKVTKKDYTISFFTLNEYEEWKKLNNEGKGWHIKYYKGLGTSTDKEFKEYFSEFERHQLEFRYSGEEDIDAIDMAFNKTRAEDRKRWIQAYDGSIIDHTQDTLTYSDFINKELVQFSRYDTERSISCMVDGLKPGQRKVLFAAIKRNLKNEVKVAQFTGYVAEKACYHHGEMSLQQTIVGMAQKFVGSNNMNLLEPCGQFGSRKEGGKDASAPRYICTRLALCARHIFHPSDDALLEYQNEEGSIIEPKFYVPVIPTVLVNGAEGIGTGWSCNVPNFNPMDVIENIRLFLRGLPMEPMKPWYRNFKGHVDSKENGRYDTVGVWKKLDDATIEITELPVKKWTSDYKAFLDRLLPRAEAAKAKAAQGAKSGRGAAKDKDDKDDKENEGGGGGGHHHRLPRLLLPRHRRLQTFVRPGDVGEGREGRRGEDSETLILGRDLEHDPLRRRGENSKV